ncbi:MAG TPA: M14 family zinc carboxypeptidase [Planctomycetota bacterium]|nr:M14 family zinc carboxypeptidase [Planctomycetota bacterium]
MSSTRVFNLAVALSLVALCAAELSAAVPTLSLSAEWPEQRIEKNVIHKTRVPRGGGFEVIATLDLTDVPFQRWDRPRVVLAATPEIAPVRTIVDGAAREKPDTTVPLEPVAKKTEVRWRFELPWTVRSAEPEYTFLVQVMLPGAYADLKKSVTVEQGVSCYDTTFTARLKSIAESRFCRLESIGKSTFGREMYFLRVTDFDVPAAGKVQFVMIGAYHGNEPSGHGSILDFVHEITTKPANRRYLEKTALYIVPCMNPDGREAGLHDHPNGVDMNHVYDQETVIAEAANVAAVLDRCKPELVRAIGITTHQWGRPHILLSHSPRERDDWSDRLMKNVGIRLSNETDKVVHVQSALPAPDGKVEAIRGYMLRRTGIPNFVVETRTTGFNVGRQMPSMVQELHLYYAVLDQLIEPTPVTPRLHPPVKMDFPPGKNCEVFKVATPPTIDGKLDEACWKHPSVITGFVTGGRQSRPQGRTTVHVVYDDANLYVAYDVPDLKPSTLQPGQPGNLWTQDGADFMLDTNLNRWTYFQFMTNANGAMSEGYWVIPGIADSDTFRPKGIEAAGSVEHGAIEVKIPFASLNGHPEMRDAAVASPPAPGTVWGVNFFRNVPSTSWAPMSGPAHAPWEFNAMTFTGKTR